MCYRNRSSCSLALLSSYTTTLTLHISCVFVVDMKAVINPYAGQKRRMILNIFNCSACEEVFELLCLSVRATKTDDILLKYVKLAPN